jgi:hypothetical protein
LGPNHATLFEASEQLQNICPDFGRVGSFILEQQLVHNGGYAACSIDAGENIPRGAAELKRPLGNQQHILGGMEPAAGSEREDGVHIHV